jgi:mono/diheme cytochrome c family protein
MQFDNSVRAIVFASGFACVAIAQAAQIGGAEQGLAIARTRCAECHLLGKETGRSENENAPTFAKIAETPGMTAAALRAALNSSHRTMPNLVLEGDDVDSIIAYILSLKADR